MNKHRIILMDDHVKLPPAIYSDRNVLYCSLPGARLRLEKGIKTKTLSLTR